MPLQLKRGTLWKEVTSRTARALDTGTLRPIDTVHEFIEDGGVFFFVRVLSSLARKEEAKRKQEKGAGPKREFANPFLPFEEDLFVADISESHVALLNKFNVVEHHLLVVTRHFEDQQMMLNIADFEALWACILEYPSLGFYNGGTAAGASQPHKHLQTVPLPLAPEGPPVPIAPLIGNARLHGGIGHLPGLPFLHIFAPLDVAPDRPMNEIAARTFTLYGEMLLRAGMAPPTASAARQQSGPYCLLVTRQWMLLVPRSQEFFGPVSINSLGFAGCLLVRDGGQMSLLKEAGPLTALKSVAFPSSAISS